jgi:hypothetical protein
MPRSTVKKSLKRYTAMVPRTFRATTNLGKKAINGITFFLNRTTRAVKKTTQLMDKKTANTIRSFGKKHTMKRRK